MKADNKSITRISSFLIMHFPIANRFESFYDWFKDQADLLKFQKNRTTAISDHPACPLNLP